MILYRGKRANTVEEALDLLGDNVKVYISANYDPFIADARHHSRIRKVKELMQPLHSEKRFLMKLRVAKCKRRKLK